MTEFDVVVAGGGAAGLFAAILTAQEGLNVAVASKAAPETWMSSGALDLLGLQKNELALDPLRALESLVQENPAHPLSRVSKGSPQEMGVLAQRSLQSFQTSAKRGGLELIGASNGSAFRNMLLPTQLGSFKPTAMAQHSMVKGDLLELNRSKLFVVGVRGLMAFDPRYVAYSLKEGARSPDLKTSIADTGYATVGSLMKLDAQPLENSPGILATRLDHLDFVKEFAREIAVASKVAGGDFDLIALPAILGFHRTAEVVRLVEEETRCSVFEVLATPPSVPGIRLVNALRSCAMKEDVEFFDGGEVVGCDHEGPCIKAITINCGSKLFRLYGDAFVLATGNLIGGGICIDDSGGISEPCFGSECQPVEGTGLREEFLSNEGHACFKSGVMIDSEARVLNRNGQVKASNLYAAGSVIGGADRALEKSGLGTAIITAHAAATAVVRSLRSGGKT